MATLTGAEAGSPSPGSTTRGRRALITEPPAAVSIVGIVLIALPLLVTLVAILRGSWDWLVRQAPDDTFYYLEIARRLVEGQGLTFDGINEANGFHPLWQGVATLAAFVTTDDVALLRLVLVIGWACTVAAVVLAVRELRLVFGTGPALAGGVLAVAGTNPDRWANGMEGPAVLLAFVLVVMALRRFAERPDPRRGMWVGLATALLVLARLDMVFVAWIPILFCLRALRGRDRSVQLRAVGGGALGFAALLVPFGVWFLVRFGTVTTVSAQVKQDWMGRLTRDAFGGRFSSGNARYIADEGRNVLDFLVESASPARWADVSWVPTLLFLVAFAGAVALVAERRAGRLSWPAAGRDAVVAGAAIVVVKSVLDLILLTPWAPSWYSALPRLGTALALGVLCWYALAWVWRASPPAGVVVAVVAALLVVPVDVSPAADSATTARRPGAWRSEIDEAADWILTDGPVGRYGALDAGLLGYRLEGSGRELVNLDGLVNDYEFAELLAAEVPFTELLAHDRVEYVVNRLHPRLAAQIADCGTVLWSGGDGILATEDLGGPVYDIPVTVTDVRGCYPSG